MITGCCKFVVERVVMTQEESQAMATRLALQAITQRQTDQEDPVGDLATAPASWNPAGCDLHLFYI